ncbi:polyribonucleotide nucleotidyltransferase [Azotobacter salinestris]|uniref:polyribonucleotide nucleotidyltransferase n=1 Tax=Azotobacter salinestris TaxID=69964 RepID=UPI001266DFDD|nr:polyribonucleotide nucleotidyltransferase [Azotobacter salinestris]
MHIRTRTLGGLLAVALTTQLSACGSIFFPDRRGQIEGQVDFLVVGLDAIGLLFYVIPGVIAFAVDFTTGAIYLPPGERYSVAPESLRDTLDADGRVDPARLRTLIERETGRRLPAGELRALPRDASPEQLAALGLRPSA